MILYYYNINFKHINYVRKGETPAQFYFLANCINLYEMLACVQTQTSWTATQALGRSLPRRPRRSVSLEAVPSSPTRWTSS